MSSGQMMLVIGAFMIFGIVRLNFQNTSMESEQYMESNTYVQQSATIARAMMDDIMTRPFDAILNTKSRITSTSELTSCGPGGGEHYPTFNDIDDFDGSVFRSPALGTTPSTIPACLYGTEGFTIRIKVEYVDANNPNNKSYVYTYAKRITVAVSNDYSDYTFQTSTVDCY